jgi:hypothetical protein
MAGDITGKEEMVHIECQNMKFDFFAAEMLRHERCGNVFYMPWGFVTTFTCRECSKQLTADFWRTVEDGPRLPPRQVWKRIGNDAP